MVEAHPTVPVGLIASSWGGSAIEVWMPPAALEACGEEEEGTFSNGKELGRPDARLFEDSVHKRVAAATRRSPDIGLAYRHHRQQQQQQQQQQQHHNSAPNCGIPQVPSTLWNAMIAPLLPLHVAGFLWYQGETNADKPVLYRRCFSAMIKEWRSNFPGLGQQQQQHTAANAIAPEVPFMFVQLAPWPEQSSGLLPAMRYGQEAGASLQPDMGMAVAADLGDSAGIFHPIHTPFKQEVGRRIALSAERLVFKSSKVALHGPQVVAVSWDVWDDSWGEEWHHGTPYGSSKTACGYTPPGLHPGDPPASPWVCAGLQVEFDREVELRSQYGMLNAMQSGFELLNDIAGTEAANIRPKFHPIPAPACAMLLWPNCSACACKQPLALTSLLPDKKTVQLNVTYISGKASVLRYGWDDYPTMIVYSAEDGRPAAPFNVSVPFRKK